MPFTNELINETSPYLLQHAHNPVNWHPWNKQTLELARNENKPILLSIGYAACHWCHVMAHESFEDLATADLMNQFFINIKVDKEERPDLDKIYQSTHYLLTQQSGGWPLTVFLTPNDLTPFFSGTYFPPTEKYQLPSFKDVLRQIADAYQHRKADIKHQNADLQRMLHPIAATISDVRLNTQPLTHAQLSLQRKYNRETGGFGSAPKFPQATKLEFLLHKQPDLAIATLIQMAKGGIYDHIGGGFFRYTVDANWRIPHFEKMLYDNAQLLYLYSLAQQSHPHPIFAQVIKETADWLITAMQSDGGGFFTSCDADTEGQEGKYYCWDKNEIKALLTEDEYRVIELHFGLDMPANFEHAWHIYVNASINSIAEQLHLSLSNVALLISSAKAKLDDKRRERPSPARDIKILTAWNAATIKAMLIAGQTLNATKYHQAAEKCLGYIYKNQWLNQRLKNGFLDDYAYLLDAVMTGIELNVMDKYKNFAIDIAESLLMHFADKENGGFYFTADDHELVLYRPKQMMDEATPAGNAIAAGALLRLGRLLNEKRYRLAAEKTLHAAWPLITQYPDEHCGILLVLDDYLIHSSG